jgi:hypothetical protein
MTLSTIVSNVANEAGYTVETNVLTSSETTTKQIRTMVQRINREMGDKYMWPMLFASGSFTTVAGQAAYQLPAAFSFYHYNTFWNQSTRWRLLGPMTEQEYAEILGYGLNTTVYQRFQIRGMSNNQLLMSPTPTETGQVIIFEYVAERYARPATWVTNTLYTANAYTFYNGNYYQTAGGGTSGATPPTHTSGTVSDGGVSWTYYSGTYPDFLADTDVSVFNEKTLELGVLERFAEIHGLTVAPRFEVQMNEDFSKLNPGKILYTGGLQRNLVFARDGIATFGTFI